MKSVTRWTRCSVPPTSGWDGGTRSESRDAHTASGGHAAREQRHLLLPALHAVQSRVGWISEGALNYICQRLTIPPADAYGVATFYALLSTDPPPPPGAPRLRRYRLPLPRGRSADRRARRRRPGRRPPRHRRVTTAWLRSPCLGLCDQAPAALLTQAGDDTDRTPLRQRYRRGAAAGARGTDRRSRRTAPPPSAGRRSLPASPQAGRRGRSRQPRRLPIPRRLSVAPARDRARPRRGHPRGDRLEAHGARRRRLSHREKVGRRGAPAGAAALPDLQRGRIGARHLQGPGDHGRRPLRPDRGDDHRRLRDRLRARLHLRSRRVSPGDRAARRAPSTRRAREVFWATT